METKPAIIEPDMKKREAARQELQLYKESRSYRIRRSAKKALRGEWVDDQPFATIGCLLYFLIVGELSIYGGSRLYNYLNNYVNEDFEYRIGTKDKQQIQEFKEWLKKQDDYGVDYRKLDGFFYKWKEEKLRKGFQEKSE